MIVFTPISGSGTVFAAGVVSGPAQFEKAGAQVAHRVATENTDTVARPFPVRPIATGQYSSERF